MCIENLIKEIEDPKSIYYEAVDNILTYNVSKEMRYCLMSEVYLAILEKGEEEINIMLEAGWFKYWFIRVLMNQVKSSSSPYYKNCIKTIASVELEPYMEYKYNNIYDYNDTEYFDDMKESVKNARDLIKCNWFDAEVFRMYYDEKMSFRDIERETGIDHVLAWNSINKNKKKLKEAALKIFNKKWN